MKMRLAGEWVDRDKKIEVQDPFDNSVIDTVPRADAADVEAALAAAVHGFETARKLTVYERAQILTKTARIVGDRLEEFATTIAREGSKTIREARKEARRCVNTLTISGEAGETDQARPLKESIMKIRWDRVVACLLLLTALVLAPLDATHATD